MLNPSYLIRSRHAVFYFRYPLPQQDNKRVSISLKTRCPKEALRLSKALEYHAFMVMNNPEIQSLDYAEVKEILRNHFAEVLKKQKAKIDKDGAMSLGVVKRWRDLHEEIEDTIAAGDDEIGGFMFDGDADIPEELRLDTKLKPIAERHGISLEEDSKEHRALRNEYKHAFKGYIEALLAYNEGAGYYDYSASVSSIAKKHKKRSELKLGNVVAKYLEDDNDKDRRGYRDKRDSVNYLLEVFDADHLITDIDYSDVRMVKDMLVGTPTNRNKRPETRGLPLERQIEVCREAELAPFKDTNVQKYLGYMSSLFKWAKQNKYVSENPFEGMKVKVSKTQTRRAGFKKDEIQRILSAIEQIDKSKALDKTRYWAVLLYVFTGARLNEIASLMLEDIKEYNGIWYLDITDEEETKRLKTGAAKRLVPIHSKLEELGFFDYLEHARQMIAKKPKTSGYDTRLLYMLKYNKDGGWGRGISRWFNNTFLPALELKSDVHVLHSLRHSFITSLNDAGVQAQEIMALAGHEQGTVTFGKYAKFTEAHLPVSKEAIEKLGY